MRSTGDAPEQAAANRQQERQKQERRSDTGPTDPIPVLLERFEPFRELRIAHSIPRRD